MDSCFSRPLFFKMFLSASAFFLVHCASYQWGKVSRGVPGDYHQVHVPIFKNYSMEPGVEVEFTNALVEEFERGHIASIKDPSQAEVIVEGEITSVNYSPYSLDTTGPTRGFLMAGGYSITVNVKIRLKRAADGVVLIEQDYSQGRNYTAPKVKTVGLNSANSLYNLSARRQNIQVMAKAMMADVHDRLTDNF